jgi:hypothetical protein
LSKFKLDDFIYEQAGIDEIFQRIEASLTQPRQMKLATPAVAKRPPPPPPKPRV